MSTAADAVRALALSGRPQHDGGRGEPTRERLHVLHRALRGQTRPALRPRLHFASPGAADRTAAIALCGQDDRCPAAESSVLVGKCSGGSAVGFAKSARRRKVVRDARHSSSRNLATALSHASGSTFHSLVWRAPWLGT